MGVGFRVSWGLFRSRVRGHDVWIHATTPPGSAACDWHMMHASSPRLVFLSATSNLLLARNARTKVPPMQALLNII